MKHILKFNESVDQSDRLTQADFDLIENLFLFWSDERPISYLQYPDATVIEDSKINDNTKSIKVFFGYSTSNLVNQRSQTHGKKICFPDKEFEKIFGFEQLASPISDSFTINNVSDLEDRFGPFPKKPRSAKQKVLSVLDVDYNIKQDILDILDRTKGLEYYGFDWNIVMVLQESRSYYSEMFSYSASRYLICFDLYILLTIKK